MKNPGCASIDSAPTRTAADVVLQAASLLAVKALSEVTPGASGVAASA
jgi:hypothetical protein